MKVWELIALLQQVDPTLDVYTHANEDMGNPRSVVVVTQETEPYFKGDSAHRTYSIEPTQPVVYITEQRPPRITT